MGKQSEILRLDEGLNMIFRSKNQQIMLSKIHEYRDFTSLIRGEEPVQIITPQRKMFTAYLEQCSESHNDYFVTPVGERPVVSNEDALLILFQAQRQTALSQAQVVSVMGLKFRISAVDPRKKIRYKTRMAVEWQPVSANCLQQLRSGAWTVVRKREPNQKFFEPTKETEHLVREFISSDGTNSCSAPDLFDGVPARGLMVDLSEGGFCFLSSDAANTDLVKNNILISIRLVLPHVVNNYVVEAIAAVRHVRKWEMSRHITACLLSRFQRLFL